MLSENDADYEDEDDDDDNDLDELDGMVRLFSKISLSLFSYLATYHSGGFR